MRRHLLLCLLAAAAVLVAANAWAVNQVEVLTYDQLAPNSTVDIRVKISNDVALRSLVVPLVFRSDVAGTPKDSAGTQITSMTKTWQERLPITPGSPLQEIRSYNTYRAVLSNGNCKAGQPGGFSAPAGQFDTNTVVSNIVNYPVGLLFFRGKIFSPDLPIGSDTQGSISISCQLNAEEGCFIVDTTCVNPSNHLLFTWASTPAIAPSFTRGFVCVGIEACKNAGLSGVVLDSAIWDGSGNAIDFYWQPKSGAASYELQVASDQDFTTIIHETTGLTDPHYQALFSVGANLPFYWRVRAVPAGPTPNAKVTADPPACIGDWTISDLYTDVKVISSTVLPESYGLAQNYPNPFNASTVINFTNKRDGHVTLEVFNILGQPVVTLVDDFKALGVYSVDWDGRDSNGREVPSGMYFYRLKTNDFSDVKKMTMLK